jgi:PAS domain S-box-containing protein
MARIRIDGLDAPSSQRLCAILADEGHDIVGGDEELATGIGGPSQPCDLAIVDGAEPVHLNDARELRRKFPDLPLILVLADRTQPWLTEFHELQPATCLAPPFTPESVLPATRQGLAETKRRRELHDYRTLVENQTDLVVRLTPDLVLRYASPSYCRTFGTTLDRLLGNAFTPRVHVDDIQHVLRSLSNLAEPPHTSRHRERAMTTRGWRWFEWSARGVPGPTGAIAEIISVGRDITEQVTVEEQRQRYREELDRAQEFARLGTWSYDLRTKKIAWSRGMARIVGVPEPALPSPDNLRTLIHPDDWDGFRTAIKRAAEAGEASRLTVRISRPDSQHRHLVITCEAERNPDGEIVGVVGGAQDVTELELARIRNEQLTQFPAQNPYPVLRISAEGTLLYANESCEEILANWQTQVGKPIPSPWDEPAANALASGETQRAEVICGEVVYVLAFAPVADGNFVNVYGMDITELRHTQDQTLALKAFYQTILESVHEGIWVTDSEDRLTFVNPALERIDGVPAGELLGKCVLADPPPDLVRSSRPFYEEARRTRRPVAYETKLATTDGRFSVRSGWLVPRFRGNRFDGMICTIQDITERVLAERELKLKSDAVENSLNGFYMANQDGQLVYANRAYLRMWGYDSSEEALGSPLASHFEDPLVPQRIIETLRDDGRCTLDFTARQRNGKTFEAYLSAYLHRDADERELYVGSVVDISERKRAENILARHHEEMENAVRQRTAELRTMVNAMVGREIRMAELKRDIRRLREQVQEHDLTPVVEDPIGEE